MTTRRNSTHSIATSSKRSRRRCRPCRFGKDAPSITGLTIVTITFVASIIMISSPNESASTDYKTSLGGIHPCAVAIAEIVSPSSWKRFLVDCCVASRRDGGIIGLKSGIRRCFSAAAGPSSTPDTTNMRPADCCVAAVVFFCVVFGWIRHYIVIS